MLYLGALAVPSFICRKEGENQHIVVHTCCLKKHEYLNSWWWWWWWWRIHHMGIIRVAAVEASRTERVTLGVGIKREKHTLKKF